MEKSKLEKYVDIAFLVVGVVIFGFIAHFAINFGIAIIKAIF